ncbi:hypothetical protein HII31_00267 [Pseudocercospora fuligena]|uniref:Uncharacterized protein n=1 Tax=Pseudocercospora fuligena TaxID=685502 RepID=A0A8H6RW64_9PEZI|nr:hypothetical protein HII31_00267 [Pseudocercospora fuligena]
MLGYGYRSDHFWYGVEKYKPSAIILDSGSTDGGQCIAKTQSTYPLIIADNAVATGPYKLGMSRMTCGRGSYVRDLEPILNAAYHKKIKVLIGSVGGDGSEKHVQEMLDIVKSIAESKGYSFKVATINAGIDRELITSRIRAGKVGPCGPVEPLTEEVVHSAVDVVAQMGCEPYLAALRDDPDIILGGRSYDPAPFAAFCLARGVNPGVAWHMGKIMECGGFCALPRGRSMVATIRKDSFDLTPLAAEERCTPLSVAAHTLYEKTRPDRLPGPGGVLVLDDAKYEQITPKTTRVSGAQFLPSPVYQIKLEGVTKLGYRTIFIGGIRDPILIGQIDDFLERVRKYSQSLFPELDQSEHCRLLYQIYGRNAVMGPLEPSVQVAHEIGVLGEVLAPTQELSYTIANNVRASILHFPYPDQIATTGNFASPLSPHEQEAGPVFKFSLYHLVDLQPGEEVSLFPVSYHNIVSNEQPQAVQGIDTAAYTALETSTMAPVKPKEIPAEEATLPKIASVVRSKNSGPFELTLDVMFDLEEAYLRVKRANLLTNATIRKLYNVEDDQILTNMYFDPALAWKATIKRPWPQGSVGERDTLGTQQHAPLLGILVPPMKTSAVVQSVVHAADPAPKRHEVDIKSAATVRSTLREIEV